MRNKSASFYHSLSILGTSSDVGKSTLTFVIGALLQKRGIATAPFKAQNVSNNSHVADDGSEIAISTHFQASVMQTPTSWHLNPVLLKSGSANSASLIVRGKEVGEREVLAYYQEIDTLKPVVKEGFEALQKCYDCVVAEGAGGCVELNLLEKDLSNTFIAREFQTKIILVADIEKGGVFASIYGTLALLEPSLRQNVIGVVVNKFRGDRSLFDEGVSIIEERFGVRVLGVLPYKSLNLGFEDRASLQNYTQKSGALIRVGVIALPHLSNFNDFEPLVLDEEVEISFIQGGIEGYDMVILPGSKQVVRDLLWLKKRGLFEALQHYTKPVVGICGGYEMMFEKIVDPLGVESEYPEVEGLGFFKGTISFKAEKTVKKGLYKILDESYFGYEIHYGISDTYPLYAKKERYFGTFLHGVFNNDAFRTFLFGSIDPSYKGYVFSAKKERILEEFLAEMERYLDIDEVIGCISK